MEMALITLIAVAVTFNVTYLYNKRFANFCDKKMLEIAEKIFQ